MWLLEKKIAHRGLHTGNGTTEGEISENSMTSFRNAAENGYIIETDVHLLKTGEVVVFHDGTLKRMCGKDVKIGSLTLDDVMGDKYLLPNGERLPLLQELVDLCEETNTPILLELKINGMNYDLEKACLKIIKGKESFIAIQAFNPYTIKWFKKHAPEFTRGILAASVLVGIAKCMSRKTKPHFFAVGVADLKPSLRKYCTKKGRNLIVWTVRNAAAVEKAIKTNVDNIIFEKTDVSAFTPTDAR